MKKNLLVLGLAACMALGLTACSGTDAKTDTTAAQTTGAETTKADETTAKDAADTTAAADAAADTTAADTTAAESGAAGGKLIMGTNAEFPPYEYHEGGEIVGIDADIARAIADKLGMELVIEDMSFDSIIPAVQSGKIDIGVAGITADDERRVSVDFTDTYAQASQVIIVKEDSAIAGKDDLNGKKIGVQLGTTGDLYASGDVKDGTIERYSKGMEAVQALSQGKIDAVVIDREPAKVFVKENAGLKILDEAYTEEEYAIALKKGNQELLDKINGALKELKESGELQKIVDKYISAE